MCWRDHICAVLWGTAVRRNRQNARRIPGVIAAIRVRRAHRSDAASAGRVEGHTLNADTVLATCNAQLIGLIDTCGVPLTGCLVAADRRRGADLLLAEAAARIERRALGKRIVSAIHATVACEAWTRRTDAVATADRLAVHIRLVVALIEDELERNLGGDSAKRANELHQKVVRDVNRLAVGVLLAGYANAAGLASEGHLCTLVHPVADGRVVELVDAQRLAQKLADVVVDTHRIASCVILAELGVLIVGLWQRELLAESVATGSRWAALATSAVDWDMTLGISAGAPRAIGVVFAGTFEKISRDAAALQARALRATLLAKRARIGRAALCALSRVTRVGHVSGSVARLAVDVRLARCWTLDAALVVLVAGFGNLAGAGVERRALLALARGRVAHVFPGAIFTIRVDLALVGRARLVVAGAILFALGLRRAELSRKTARRRVFGTSAAELPKTIRGFLAGGATILTITAICIALTGKLQALLAITARQRCGVVRTRGDKDRKAHKQTRSGNRGADSRHIHEASPVEKTSVGSALEARAAGSPYQHLTRGARSRISRRPAGNFPLIAESPGLALRCSTCRRERGFPSRRRRKGI